MKSSYRRICGFILFLFVFFFGFNKQNLYAGCPTGSYCAGTTVVDLTCGCTSSCTQCYEYTYIGCDNDCHYETYGQICNSSCQVEKIYEYHSGSCCTTSGDDDDDGCIPSCSLPACPTGYSTTNQSCSTASCPDGWERFLKSGDSVYSCRKRNSNGCGGWCDYQYCYTNATNTSAPVAPDYAIMSTPFETKNLSISDSSRTIFDYRQEGAITVSSSTTPTDSTIVGYRYRLRLTPDGSDLEDTGDGTDIIRSLTYSPFPTMGVILAQRYNWRCPDNTVIQRSDSTYGYFCMERNVKPPTTPTGMDMTIDGQVYHLSTDEPKVVKYPTTDATKTNTKLHVLPTRDTPDTASDSGYRVEANNYGLEEDEWTAFSCERGEDFCNEGTDNEYNFSPNTEELLDVLKEGAKGKIDGQYYNVNECDATKVYSDPQDFYYKVNNNPDFISCPTIKIGDDITSEKGCESTTHTGTEVNNPLKFEIVGSDLDGVEEIKGAIIWLTKDGTSDVIPDFPSIVGTYTESDPNNIAVMVLQRNDSWDNNPYIYTADSQNNYYWRNITSQREIRTSAGVMARVLNADGVVNGGNVIFHIELDFTPVTDQTVYPEGNYNISSLVFDEHMLLADGTVVDQFYMSICSEGSWNIDLRNPTFETGSPSLAEETGYARDATLLWNFDGTGSYATDAVINGYSNSPMEEINLKIPPGYTNKIIPVTPPDDDEIGKLNDTNAWAIPNPSESVIYDSNAVIGIGSNEEGEIIFYVTGFDQACNYISKSTTINFNPWMPSKGGLMYSGGNVGANSNGKYYSAYDTFIDSVLRKVTADELDIATEVVASRSGLGTINNFIHPELKAVKASGIYNSNNEMSSWYEYLSDRLDEQIEQMVALGQSNFKSFKFPDDGEISKNRISDYCSASEEEYCYMNVQGNLDVVPLHITHDALDTRRFELICDRKTLIMASGNIHIEPDIRNGGDDKIDGCIFVAGGSITIGAGDWVTQPVTELEETKYDYLDAYLVADGKIDIQLVDLKEPGEAGSVIYTRDGLEIYGGLVAFGRNIPTGDSAVQVNRKLGVWSAYIPPAVITWDPRYAKLAELFFGSTAGMYKREVGFKPY